jgi:hypothetical protein
MMDAVTVAACSDELEKIAVSKKWVAKKTHGAIAKLMDEKGFRGADIRVRKFLHNIGKTETKNIDRGADKLITRGGKRYLTPEGIERHRRRDLIDVAEQAARGTMNKARKAGLGSAWY